MSKLTEALYDPLLIPSTKVFYMLLIDWELEQGQVRHEDILRICNLAAIHPDTVHTHINELIRQKKIEIKNNWIWIV